MPDERIPDILTELHDRERRGERIDLDAIVREHPALAAELRAHVEALDVLDQSFEGEVAEVPERIGDYRIEKELGRGGMGIVYLARDPQGRQVALKVIHPHLLERRGFFKRFLREAEIGKRVRHENVVRTLEVDAVQVGPRTVHFLVMEYVEGKTLRTLGRELGTVPEALLREVALQAAAGLAAIHGAGIVHRDLKPENLLITDDHRVRIMDLGVARPVQETLALTQEDQFAGSLLYAAPEQFERTEIGPAADLYALGVLLYELATGDNPFRSDEMAAVMKAQLELVPPRVNEKVPEVSAFFSELVASLLEKGPEVRIGSAEALRDLLQRGEQTSWWSEREREVIRARQRIPAIPVRRETKLYGRETELGLLREAWERAQKGRGNTILLQGEAGIGKSRLVDAFLGDGDGRDANVLYGSYPPSGGMGGISDAIVGQFGERDLEERLRPHLTVTPSLVPAFAAMVRHDSPPPGAPSLEGDALHAVCVHLMRSLAAERPLLWVVEDLHFAAPESRQLVLALARALEGHKVLLVLTTRPGLAQEEFAHFSRLENFRRADLGRLSAREVILLLQDAFRSETLADKLGARIALKSDGVPFFVFEMIRGLKEGQFIEQLPDGSYVESQVIEEIEVPSAVRDLIEARLRDLARQDRAILDIGAVLGYEFDPDLVARVRRLLRVQVLEVLADIERRSGVVRASGSRYRFDHHQIQEVVYANLSQGLKEEYHTLLAQAYLGCVGDKPSGEDHAFLASHNLSGSHPEDGLPHLIPALDHLKGCYRNEAAIELATVALDAPGVLEGKERAEVLRRKAARHDLRGEREMVQLALSEALALAESSGDIALRAKLTASLGWSFLRTSDHTAAESRCRQALDLAHGCGDWKVEARASMVLGCALEGQCRWEEARAELEKARTLAREIGNSELEAFATGNLGNVFLDEGRIEEGRSQHEKYLILAREIGSRVAEAQAILGLAAASDAQGRLEEALALYDRVLALARETGDRNQEELAISNLARVFGAQGRYEEALTHIQKTVSLARETGSRGEVFASHMYGFVLLSLGRYEEARAHFERGLAWAREIGDRRREAYGIGSLGGMLWFQGRREEARAHAERRLALARKIGDHAQESESLAFLASLEDDEGNFDAAVRLYREALALDRRLGNSVMAAETLVGLGQVEIGRGDQESAIRHLDEALSLAREVRAPSTVLLATVQRARLSGGDTRAALGALAENEERADHASKVECRYRLWELTGDSVHLTEAKRLLDFGVGHSPEEYRTSMIENVPLHRDIMKAWEEQGEKGA